MNPTSCDVQIYFGSYATGIDRAAAATVHQLLGSDPAVAEVSRSPSGMEGDYTLCAHTTSAEAAASLFERLIGALPGPVTAPISVTGPNGSYSAPVR